MKKCLFKKLIIVGVLGMMAGSIIASDYPKLILAGDYPDPSIVRDGEDYYMTHSPFLYTPGFLIWHSKDLVNWTPVCRAMTEVIGSSMAPDILKHEGRFYIYIPAAGKNWVIWADDIRGPWSKPIRLDVGYIDPGHAVGEDGKRYLFLSAGHRIPLADDGLSVAGKLEKVYDGWDYPKEWVTEGKYLESPKLFRKGDYFYQVSAEGGTAGPPTSHMVIVARSKSIHGPWENTPHNPIVHTYSADEQWWSKGHGTIIDDVNGNWWIVYHAYENGHYPLGRQTLLDPIDWTDDGWPVLAKTPHPLPAGDGTAGGMELSDDFDGKELGLQWTTWRDYAGVALKNGRLQLEAKGATPKDARLLLVTAEDHAYEVQAEVVVEQGTSGGLVLFYSDRAFAGIVSDGKQFTVYENAEKSTQYPNPFGRHFFVKIVNRANTCELLASKDGKEWMTLRSGLDVSDMHHNKYRGFFALRPGLVSIGEGTVHADHFEYRALTAPVAWTNPIVPQRADPHVFLHDGWYYLAATAPKFDCIELRRARTLGGLATAEVKVVWERPESGPMSGRIWAPEIHFIDGKWYLYFSGGERGGRWFTQRMYALENDSPNPLEGSWVVKGQVKSDWEYFSLDATTFEHKGVRYYVWTQVDPEVKGSNIYIAKMDTPWSLSTRQVELSKPEFPWEQVGHWVNEAPAVLVKNGRVFITYSASATDANYCMGLLTADADADLLDPKSWKKEREPVFKSDVVASQFGPGHNSFTTTLDGRTDIMVYHARNYEKIKGSPLANPDRATRAQVLRWKADGTPDFGTPVADGPYALSTAEKN